MTKTIKPLSVIATRIADQRKVPMDFEKVNDTKFKVKIGGAIKATITVEYIKQTGQWTAESTKIMNNYWVPGETAKQAYRRYMKAINSRCHFGSFNAMV